MSGLITLEMSGFEGDAMSVVIDGFESFGSCLVGMVGSDDPDGSDSVDLCSFVSGDGDIDDCSFVGEVVDGDGPFIMFICSFPSNSEGDLSILSAVTL